MITKLQLLKGVSKALRRGRLSLARMPGGNQLLSGLSKFIGDLSIEFHGLTLTGSLLHRRELWSIQAGAYEPFTVELFLESVQPRMTICDVGAHIGFYSLLAAKTVGLEGKVYAFEPDPRNFSYLVRNIQANGFQDVVVAIPKAVSDFSGHVPLQLNPVTTGGSSLHQNLRGGSSVKIACVSLDEFFSLDSPVDVIKLDIEGAEVQAITGMKQLLAHNKNITLFVECNPTMLQAAGFTVNDLIATLTECGFHVQMINEEEKSLEDANPQKILLKAAHSQVPNWSINLYCTR